MKLDIVRRLTAVAHYATPRYSLGQLLFAVTLIAVGFGWWTGRVTHTGRELDAAILGDGYFQVMDPDSGQIVYTRDGHLTLNDNGILGLIRGAKYLVLQPPIALPLPYTQLEIGPDGVVSCVEGGQVHHVGQIQLCGFPHDPMPVPNLDGIFCQTLASGPGLINNPSNHGFGRVAQGYLEATRIDIAKGLLPLALLGIGAWLLVNSRRLLERLRSWRGAAVAMAP